MTREMLSGGSSENERVPRWGRRVIAGIGSVGVLCGATVIYRSMDSDVNEHANASFGELEVLIINHPNAHLNDDVSEAKAGEVFQNVGTQLYKVTDGAIKTPSYIPIHTIAHRPTGSFTHEDSSVILSCLSSDDIDNARTAAFDRDGVPLTSRTAVIVNGGPACDEIGDKKLKKGGAAAWVTRGKNENEQTVYAVGFNENLVMHEEGHVDGLNHAAIIECDDAEDSKGNYPNLRSIDIADLLTQSAYNCAVPLVEPGKPDHYSDKTSAMGSRASRLKELEPYSFVEINKLAPTAAVIDDIMPENTERIIGLDHDDVRGLRLKLPDGHPLRSVDPSLRFLNIGLLHDRNKSRAFVRLIASGEGTSYTLEYASNYTPVPHPRAKQTIGKSTLYTDKSLGITIAADVITDDQGNRATDKVLVSIEPIPR